MATDLFLDGWQFVVVQTGWKDWLDLLLVWVVVYRVLLLTQTRGTTQVLMGIGVLALGYWVSVSLELVTFYWILDKILSHLFLIIFILFQGEIRSALAEIGRNPFAWRKKNFKDTHVVEELAKGCTQLAQKGFGALIVIERKIGLDYFIEVGSAIDASVLAETICSIFHPSSPLHDGAVIIREGRLQLAGCFLPLSKNPILDKNLGTRHRAAIGLTEETDALVIVVSEENHSLGVVSGGQLQPDLDHGTLRRMIYDVYGFNKEGDEA